MAKPHLAWGTVRAYLRDETFDDIKEIAGHAGVNMGALAHLHQRSTAQGNGATKGQLLSALDGELARMPDAEQGVVVRFMTELLLARRPNLSEPLADDLARHGWGIADHHLVALELFDPAELAQLPAEPRADLLKAGQRLRDGDLGGAVSAACGAVDTAVAMVYARHALGDPRKASFQEGCNRALQATVDLDTPLRELGWPDAMLKPFGQNFRGALNQGAFVMQTLRSQMGDVHGTKPVLKTLVFDALKWAELFVRTLTIR
ncbi:conserved protein of unknown function (plasmid) [Cupriavidus taiwanensis]|uniref:Abortive infection protein-like C-terminal domain-containing protein n=1 Tax=Cupriavidus taiwanensis TaxID=164546 RepID=A0A375EGM3_9BURK|nr:hypothetical protein [Cupriavidus taiwanensis]SOZ71192.1 conserved protein of unknown function [Cupriavidus taiwanensis]SOZ72262.1 conserved protein of unknown function [Cupriavidus taiwanensis]SOZ74562.1 conserved protein of unknown function [Cupriavidus taiwanensis]SPA03486.1 conserved protein of unknown function [Cupriavidus taiwanensis]SPA12728.1 conserved hypothetical protein [Cupriavidus taiwanensis]